MQTISRLEQVTQLDRVITPVQRAVRRLLPPGRDRDALHGVWLGHPLHPVLVQAPVGAWLSAAVLDLFPRSERDSRRLVAFGLLASAPAALAGTADWSEQHEQQMRVGVVHAAVNIAATSLYGASLAVSGPRAGKALRFAGLTMAATEQPAGRPHLVPPGWWRESGRASAAPRRAGLARRPAGCRRSAPTAWSRRWSARCRSWSSRTAMGCMCSPTAAAICPGRCPTAMSAMAA